MNLPGKLFPKRRVPPIGTVGFVEGESQKYVVESGDKGVENNKDIKTHITVGENPSGEPHILPLEIYAAVGFYRAAVTQYDSTWLQMLGNKSRLPD